MPDAGKSEPAPAAPADRSHSLLRPGSLAGSLGVYLPAMILHKGLGLTRVLLFAYFLRNARGEYGLWSLGLMIFSLLGPLVCLGSNHGLARYVGFHEARGRLRQFYSRARLAVPTCCLLLSLVALYFREPIARAAIAACQSVREGGVPNESMQVALCCVAILNALLLALYYNLLAFLGGMRLYRLISAVEIAFGALFAALGCAALAWRPYALVLLLAHLAAVGLALAGGAAMLHAAVRRRAAAEPSLAEATREPAVLEGAAEGEPSIAAPALPASADRGGAGQVLSFGFLSLVGAELWAVAGWFSFYLVSRTYKEEAGGQFSLFRQLAEPVAFVAASAWTVVYGHVARKWEGGRREEAAANLQTAFKAVALLTLTLGVLVLAAAPLWLKVLSESWRSAADLLPGLLLFYLMVGNLGLVSMVSWLLERPVLAWLAPVAAIAANGALAALWMPSHGPVGAAWAGGAGLAAGGGAVGALCLLLSRLRLQHGTYILLLSPAILALALMSVWAVITAWVVVFTAAATTGLLFDAAEKSQLRDAAKRLLSRSRSRGT